MKNAFVMSALLIGLSFSTFAAEQPVQKKQVVRTLQSKTGKKIRTSGGQVAKVRQSGFHKSLG